MRNVRVVRLLAWCVVLMAVALAAACGGSSGDRIAFVTTGGGDPEIAVLDVKTGEATTLTENQSKELSPRWSPDGKTIAFSSDQSGGLEINLLDVKERTITRLTYNGGDDRTPLWSPEGDRIAFMSEHGDKSDMYVMPLAGGEPNRISINAGNSGDPILGGWSPDGQWLVFYSDGSGDSSGDDSGEERGLWLRNPNGVNILRLTTGLDRDPAWSPDGDMIAFVRRWNGSDDIFVLRFLGGGSIPGEFDISRLTQHESNDQSPNWSPDGLNLVFVSYRDGNGEIYSMAADGSKQRRLTNNEADDVTPDWSPDSRRIVFVSYVYGQSEVFVMNADGSDQRRLTNNSAEDYDPNW